MAEEEFDETAYRAINADVDAAIKAGIFESGRQHFQRHGRQEGRQLSVRLSRRDKLLGGLDISRMRGLEIGPLMTPLVCKDDGDILYVDHADTETLRAKYACVPGVDLARIVRSITCGARRRWPSASASAGLTTWSIPM